MSDISELEHAVDEFAAAMKARLRSKAKQGWSGWQHMGREGLGARLLMNTAKGVTKDDQKSLIDVANLAMMIHHHDKLKKRVAWAVLSQPLPKSVADAFNQA